MWISTETQSIVLHLAANGGEDRYVAALFDEEAHARAMKTGLVWYGHDGGFADGVNVHLTRRGRAYAGLPPTMGDRIFNLLVGLGAKSLAALKGLAA